MVAVVGVAVPDLDNDEFVVKVGDDDADVDVVLVSSLVSTGSWKNRNNISSCHTLTQ